MSRITLFCSSILLILLAFIGGACAEPPVGSQEQGQQVAEEFVKMEVTFRFDGIPETLKLTSTTSIAKGWKYTIEFDSRHAGYGNRTGQVLAEVITHHTAVVSVQSGSVTSAIMDGVWDMKMGRLITPPVGYSLPELKYILISNFGNVFYVDPDYYPVAREGQEEKNAQEQFSIIKADAAEFSVILKQLHLPNKSEYTSDEKLSVYREHKKLTLAVEITALGDNYNFSLRVSEGQGERIEGTITTSGEITVLKREPSFNTYPICLTKGTLIDTPSGSIPIEQLRKGMAVWTEDNMGNRIRGTVVETKETPIPIFFQAVRVTLSDGRAVTASPGHPTAEGRALENFKVGDTLDGALVVAVEHVTYDGKTYDLLPSSEAGLYWANAILLKSTLAVK